MKRLPFHSLLVVTAAGVACAAPASEEPLGFGQEAIVTRTAIPTGPQYASTTPISLGVNGTATASDLDTSTGVAHALHFTSGSADATPPSNYSPATSYLAVAEGGANSQYESTPQFGTYLTAAINDNVALVNSTDKDHSARPVLDQVQSILGSFTTDPIVVTGPTPSFLGYTPVQARWAYLKYTQAGQSNGVYKKYQYPDPPLAGEIRERGARLYCAARRAIKEQAARPDSRFLGEQVALPIHILGQSIDIGVVQATLTLDGPQQYTGAPRGSAQPTDGAQAFHIPLLAGAKMIPIRGLPLVPDVLPEVRHPIVLTTGDSEIQTATTPTAIRTSYTTLCLPTCVPFYGTTNDSMETDRTVTHADAIGSSAAQLKWNTSFPIFTMGIFTATMNLSTTVDVGALQPIDNSRLFKGISTYPSGRTEGLSVLSGTQFFDDSALQITSGVSFWADTPMSVNSSSQVYSLPAFNPMLMRWEHNDDHHVTTRSSLTLGAGVTGNLGFSYGPLKLDFSATGQLTGAFNLDTHVRDEATVLQQAQVGTIPPSTKFLTNVTVTPSTSTDLSLKVGLDMRVRLPTPFGDIDETLNLIDPAPFGKTFGGDPWEEKHRLRLGTGSNQGFDVTNQPFTISHLPSNAADGSIPTFNAFDTQTVDACLNDPTPNPPLPPRCNATTQTGTTPHTNVCAVGHELVGDVGFGTAAQWAGACVSGTTINAAALAMAGGSSSSPYYACYQQMLSYLCSSTSQSVSSPVGVSHKISTSTSISSDARLANAINACVSASAGLPPGRVLKSTLEFKLCDDSARPLTKDEILSMGGSGGSTTAEPVGTVTTCK